MDKMFNRFSAPVAQVFSCANGERSHVELHSEIDFRSNLEQNLSHIFGAQHFVFYFHLSTKNIIQIWRRLQTTGI